MTGRVLARWLPALLIMAALGYLSHQPEWPDSATGYPDWLLHGIAYTALGAACYLGTTAGGRGGIAPAVKALAIAVTYGALDEIHQSFVPGRDAALADLLADALGAGLGVLAPAFARLQGVWEDRTDGSGRSSP